MDALCVYYSKLAEVDDDALLRLAVLASTGFHKAFILLANIPGDNQLKAKGLLIKLAASKNEIVVTAALGALVKALNSNEL